MDNSYLDNLELVVTQDKTSFVNIYFSFYHILSQNQTDDLSSKLTEFFQQGCFDFFSRSHPVIAFIVGIISTFIGFASHKEIPEDLDKLFLSEEPDNFLFQTFQKNGKLDEASKCFKEFFLNLTRIFFIFQMDIPSTDKKQKLRAEFQRILEICFKLSTGKDIPKMVITAFDILQSNNNNENLDDLMKETELKKYLDIKDDNSQISPKFFMLFKLLYVIFHRPTISLSDSVITKSLGDVVLIAGDKFVNSDLIKSLIGIIQGDIRSILNLINSLNLINQNDSKALKDIITTTQKLAIFKNRGSLQEIKSQPQQVLDDQMKEIVKRMQEGKVNAQDIFRALVNQEGQNGMISIDTFCTFLSRTGIQLSEHRATEIFATIKKTSSFFSNSQLPTSPASPSIMLSEEEFEKAYDYVTNKKINISLEKLGISAALLALSLGTLIIILILLFVFIFLGIQAFTLGGTFGSIINSIIPMGAATGTTVSQEDKSDNLNEKNIKGVVKNTEFILHSKQL